MSIAGRYTYEIAAKDGLTAKLQKIASISSRVYNKLTGGQQRFNQKLTQGATNAQTLGSKLKGMMGTYLTIGAGIMVARDSLQKWDTQAQAQAQVMQGIATTNMAAGRSFEQLTKAASDLQKKTIFGDESILQGVTAQLLTFTNIAGNSFDRTQQAALDFTTRLYGTKATTESLKSTTIMLGKALNDPVKNLSALTRTGFQVSESQEKMIKSLWKSGETAKAQSIILDELAKQYGGSAEAAAKVALGPWKQFMNMIGDFQETWGPLINKILTGFMDLFDWVQRNATVIGLISVSVLGAVGAYKTVIAVTKVWTAVQWALTVAMNANPIGLIIAGITAMVGAVVYAWYKFEGFRGVLFGLWESFKAVFTGIRDLVSSVMGGVGELILGALTFDISRIQSGLAKLGESFANYGSGIVAAYKIGADAGKKYQPKVPKFLAGADGEKGETGITENGTGSNGFVVSDPTTDGVVSNGVQNITQGGKKQTTINIVVEKFQDSINIHTTNMGSAIDDIESQIQDALLRVLNSANKVSI